MVFDKLINISRFLPSELFVLIKPFIAQLSADTGEGLYPLRGESMFARVMRYDARPKSESKIEAHDRYCSKYIRKFVIKIEVSNL